jgi:predicted phage terminase large subunit-like protein
VSGLDPGSFSATAARKQLLDIQRSNAEDSLYEFLRQAWKYMDASPFVPGWHIAAIAEHLQAIVDGQITRLIINVPPRHGKSLITSVAFPAWTWAQAERTHTCGASVQFLYASYGDNLSLRDSVKCRRLIESEWYQKYWGERFALTTDQNTKSRFTNNAGGERLITSIGGRVTGEGGNIIVIDDPNAANEIESEATLLTTLDWWKTTMPTRVNDQERSAIVIIQQRLARNDLTGYIMDNEPEGWTHLVLPGRYDPLRRRATAIGWEDPRLIEDELLWPEKFSERALARLELTMGPWAFAGQIQQAPKPKGGGIIKDEWWQLWEAPKFPPFDYLCAMVDTAFTKDEINDPSAMIVWGVFSDDPAAEIYQGKRYHIQGAPKVMMVYAWCERLEFHDLVTKVAATAKRFHANMVMIENKASGISVAQELRRLYANEYFSVYHFDPKSQDKTARLHSVVPLFAAGLVYAPDTAWAEMVMDEVSAFPRAPHDDLVDCVSTGIRYLRDNGLLSLAAERQVALDELLEYRSREQPLYPA